MGQALDAARMHFAALLDMKPHIEVPEWPVPDEAAIAAGKAGATKPLRIYYQPLTLQDREVLNKEIDEDNYAALVVARALDEKGTKLFEVGDDLFLKRSASSHVIQRIALLITALPKLTVEDARKN